MICPRCRKEYRGNLERCPRDGGTLCEPEDLARLGMRVGNYELAEIVGVGGMGVVYRAVHLLLDKPVAIKILCSQYSRRRCHPEDILREARTASRVRHRHIVDVTDFGITDDGDPYFVMELLEGESLARLLGRVGRLTPVRAVRIVRQIAAALGAAHALGIIHRDLKPENIYLLPTEPVPAIGNAEPPEERDFVKVGDFGLAKVIDMEPSSRTKEGIIAGTPVYMSPEHARCEVVDGRSDIYSLGVVFYQMATGTLPFEGSSALDFLMAHVGQPVPPPQQRCPEIDDELSAIIMRCLEKNPADRYRTMEELRQELRDYLVGQGREISWPSFDTERNLPPLKESELPTLETGGSAVQAALSGKLIIEEIGRPAQDARGDPTGPPASKWPRPAKLTMPPSEPLLPLAAAAGAPAISVAASTTASASRLVKRQRAQLLAAGALALVALGLAGALVARQGVQRRAADRPTQIRIELPNLPARALTFVDGELRAERPLVLRRAAVQHRLRVEAEGYLPEELTINAEQDQSVPLRLRPQPRPPASQGAVARTRPPERPVKLAANNPARKARRARPPKSSRVTKPTATLPPEPPPVTAKKETTGKLPESAAKVVKPAAARKGGPDPDWVIDP